MMKPTREVVYKEIKNAKLKLHVFEPKGHKGSDRRPAIVFFFGGGWVGGTPGQFYPHCTYLASRGMVAFAAEYRVKSRHNVTPYECVTDGKSAVRWIRANAETLGIDKDRLAAGGGSAGAHVAACTGTIDGLDEKGRLTDRLRFDQHVLAHDRASTCASNARRTRARSSLSVIARRKHAGQSTCP